MTPKEINIAIATACGWTDCKLIGEPGCWRAVGDEPGSRHHIPVPDYCGDLNACAEMEATLSEEECQKYQALLDDSIREEELDYPAACYWFHATAPQRCEAFLRTKGLWRD